ncbi:hypothetical protein LCGC14_2757740, partial [marine sediment metagenome]
LHDAGRRVIEKNHPEWESEPPKGMVDLFLNPDKLAISIAESAPLLIGAGILSAAGHPNLGVMMMYATEGQEAKDRAIEYGASEEDAETSYLVYGTVAAAIENMQLKGMIKITKGMFARVVNRTAQLAARQGKRGLTKDLLKEFARQAAEEATQGQWGDITAKMVYGEPFGPIGDMIDRRMQEAYIGGVTGLIPGVAGAVAGRVQRGPAEVAPVVEEAPAAVEEGKAPAAYEGKAFRAPTGTKVEGTAADVVRYEQEELGNDLGVTSEQLKELENRPASDIVWVTRDKAEAARYAQQDVDAKVTPDDLAAVEEVDAAGGRIIADIGPDGVLVLKPVEAKPPAVVEVETEARKPEGLAEREPYKLKGRETPIPEEQVKELKDRGYAINEIGKLSPNEARVVLGLPAKKQKITRKQQLALGHS